jgi:hypothetical protein
VEDEADGCTSSRYIQGGVPNLCWRKFHPTSIVERQCDQLSRSSTSAHAPERSLTPSPKRRFPLWAGSITIHLRADRLHLASELRESARGERTWEAASSLFKRLVPARQTPVVRVIREVLDLDPYRELLPRPLLLLWYGPLGRGTVDVEVLSDSPLRSLT